MQPNPGEGGIKILNAKYLNFSTLQDVYLIFNKLIILPAHGK